jgi:hypothetical protein
MNFRQLSVGDLFRFPRYDDPWQGREAEGAVWQKIGASAYRGEKVPQRIRIDNMTRSVYKEQPTAVH